MSSKSTKEPKNAKWSNIEVSAALTTLLDKKPTHQSSNGWKPTVWPDVVKAVRLADPEAKPAKDQAKLKEIFELYLFVEKFSGTGWDDEEKHAVNTAQYIEDFLASHGKKYARCFKKPCPFYNELDQVYDGLKNRATGEHVIHFPKARRKCQKAVPKENTAVTAATSASPTKATTTPTDATDTNSSDARAGARTPMAALDNVQQDVDMPADMGGHGNYDDELKVSPAKPSSKCARAESEDDDTSSESEPKARCRRHKSDSSNSSVARRNAEAGSQIAQSVENLSAAMLKPIVTTEDVSYVDDVMHILENPTMLPPDPRGRLFTIRVYSSWLQTTHAVVE
ncbi:hypothetical protein B0H14DRAFT_3127709 [Mycena olivaceomarginata]|nr:hypothetical protein B0H14DRAFT_3127709 [Mycena olivaceomarginata]